MILNERLWTEAHVETEINKCKCDLKTRFAALSGLRMRRTKWTKMNSEINSCIDNNEFLCLYYNNGHIEYIFECKLGSYITRKNGQIKQLADQYYLVFRWYNLSNFLFKFHFKDTHSTRCRNLHLSVPRWQLKVRRCDTILLSLGR